MRWRDILFSAFFTDISQYQWVTGVEDQLGEAGSRLQTMMEEQKQRLNQAESTLEEGELQLTRARQSYYDYMYSHLVRPIDSVPEDKDFEKAWFLKN